MKKLLLIVLIFGAGHLFAQDTAAYNLTAQCFLKGELLKSLDMCNDIISKDPKYTQAYVLRGSIYYDLKMPIDAFQDFNTALELEPNCYNALLGKSLYYLNYEQYDEAAIELDKAEQADDTSITLFAMRSRLYNGLHQHDKNIRQLSKGLKLYPNNILLLQSRSYAYICKHQYDSAMMDAKYTLLLDSNDMTSLTNIGFCYIKLKQYDKAYRIYKKMNITTEHHPYLMSNYGFSLYKIGKPIEGIQFIYESLKVLPENSYAHRYLAEISLQENDTEQACYHIKKSIDLGYTKDYDNDMADMQKKYCK